MENKEPIRRLKSCFICDVEIYDDHILLGDAKSNYYVIYNSDKEAVSSFMLWFKNVYMKCIPQSLVIIDYAIEENNDEVRYIAKKIISQHTCNDNSSNTCRKD